MRIIFNRLIIHRQKKKKLILNNRWTIFREGKKYFFFFFARISFKNHYEVNLFLKSLHKVHFLKILSYTMICVLIFLINEKPKIIFLNKNENDNDIKIVQCYFTNGKKTIQKTQLA